VITVHQRYRQTDRRTDRQLIMAIPRYATFRAVKIIRHGSLIQNIVINVCENKFHYDRLRNDRALGNRKSDSKNPNNECKKRTTFVSIGDPFLGSKIIVFIGVGFHRALFTAEACPPHGRSSLSTAGDSLIMPNTHRRRRRDLTVASRRVGGVY